MKKNVIILSSVGVVVVLAGIYATTKLGGAPKETPAVEQAAQPATTTDTSAVATKPGEKILATYNNGTPVYKSEVNDKLKSMFGGKLPEGKNDFEEFSAEIKDSFLRNYITSKLLFQEAMKANVADTAEVKEQLTNAKEQIVQKAFLMQKVKELTTEDKVKALYDQFAKDQATKEEVKARHILVATEEEAKVIAEEIKKGGNFEEIAKKKSSDSSKDKGGDLGYFSHGQMVKPFEDTAFSLKPGEVSAPVKSEFGWHIIKVEDKRKAAVPSFDEVKAKLQEEANQKAVQEYVSKLQADAKIEITK